MPEFPLGVAFCGIGKYDTGFRGETDILPRLCRTGEIRFILQSAVIFRNHKIPWNQELLGNQKHPGHPFKRGVSEISIPLTFS